MIDQLAVCLRNEPGRLAEMTHVLSAADIQILAIMVADTRDFCTVRMIVDRPAEADKLLSQAGFQVVVSGVVAIEVENVPGGLGYLLDHLVACDLSVEYAYTCCLGERTVDILKVIGEPLEIKLQDCGLVCLEPGELHV